MKVLVDTCIWSKALRRKSSDPEASQKLSDLIYDGRVVIIGPIRQEILSGIVHKNQFERIKNHLSAFIDIPLETENFIKAAEFNNLCRSNGIQGSAIDYLICSVAHLNNFYIYTDDNDFTFYEKYLPVKLFNNNL